MARVVAATEAAAQVAAEAAPPPVGPPAQSVALKRGGAGYTASTGAAATGAVAFFSAVRRIPMHEEQRQKEPHPQHSQTGQNPSRHSRCQAAIFIARLSIRCKCLATEPWCTTWCALVPAIVAVLRTAATAGALAALSAPDPVSKSVACALATSRRTLVLPVVAQLLAAAAGSAFGVHNTEPPVSLQLHAAI